MKYISFCFTCKKIVRSNTFNVYTYMIAVAQSADALLYKPEIRVFDFGLFH